MTPARIGLPTSRNGRRRRPPLGLGLPGGNTRITTAMYAPSDSLVHPTSNWVHLELSPDSTRTIVSHYDSALACGPVVG
jgi:hypothetical protein